MSEFLAPIHYWLYRKIRLVDERENLLYVKASELCGDLAEELRTGVWQTYGAPLPDKDLAELIDSDNIHGWLQRQIHLAEAREAGLIKELTDNCSDIFSAIRDVFAEHGRFCGKAAAGSGQYDTNSALGIFKALGDYRLNGMPCDQNDEIIRQSTEEVVWQNRRNLAAVNWQRVGMDTQVMQSLYETWLAEFISGVSPAFIYQKRQESSGEQMVITNSHA